MTTALYTDLGRVTAALAWQAPETIQNPVGAGETLLTLSQEPPSDWQVGASLVIDAANSALRETVTITAPPSGNEITVSALVNAHVAGAPVINATIAEPYPAAASRWFDQVTQNKAGFAYEQLTETKQAVVDRDGYIAVPLSKPLVAIGDLQAVTWQATPLDAAQALDVTKAWIESGYILKIAAPLARPGKVMVTATYSGGYDPIPDDIMNAVTVMAARFFKERDSGYGDTIGNVDLGITTYKKAMPSDVKVIVDARRRWTV